MKKIIFVFGALGLFVSTAFQKPPDMPTIRTSIEVNIDKEQLKETIVRVVEEIAGKIYEEGMAEDTVSVKEEEDTSDS